MNNREIQLPAIPVDFVLQQGEKEHTEAKRRPYSTLIRTWAEHEGKAEVGEKIANKLNLPVKYVGVGEQIDDLIPFDSKTFVEALFK